MSSQQDYVNESLNDNDLFIPIKESEVTFYILNRKVAPVQENLYFVNKGMTKNGRYLWFYCAFPPSLTRTLGVVDFKEKEVQYFPETQFNGASPFVDGDTGEVFWGAGKNLWKRGPKKNDEVELINSLPEELVKSRSISRLATHLTRSSDGRSFFIDAQVGLQYIFGKLPVDGTDFQHWHTFSRNHNHAQISPTDPDTVLFAQENHNDPLTGLRFNITNRLWMMKEGENPYSVLEESQRPDSGHLTHEWWDPDGKHIWAVRGDQTWKININSKKVVEKIDFPLHCWHSHSSQEGNYIVCDSNEQFYRGCPSSVNFLNRKTNKLIKIVDNPEKLDYVGSNYHIDPHPRFCGNDKYITFTTTVRNEVDLGIVSVKELINKTKG